MENATEIVGQVPSDEQRPLSGAGLVKRGWNMKLMQNRLQSFIGWVFELMSLQTSEGRLSYFTGKQKDVRSCDDKYTVDDFSSIGPNADSDINKIYNFIYSVGVEKILDFRCNIFFTSLESRLKTFEKCNRQLSQEIFSFCKAGFYYIGNGNNDQMICYSCQQGLMKWQKDDNPWAEHARWSKHCSFVLLNMGKRFVKEICGEENIPNFDHEELSTMITIHKNPLNLERNTTTNIIVKTGDQIAMLPPRNVHSSQQDVNPEAMLCKICFKEKLEVLFIPCGHLTACVQCAMTLDQCAICRYPFTILMKVYVDITIRRDDPHNLIVEPVNSPLCRVCRQNQITITCIPCRHVCVCFDCAASTNECPICFDTFFAYIQVYL